MFAPPAALFEARRPPPASGRGYSTRGRSDSNKTHRVLEAFLLSPCFRARPPGANPAASFLFGGALKMKLRSLCVALALLAGSGSIGLAQSDRYTPRLSEIMRMAQTQHLKLWLAAKAQNWDLATYEAQQLKTSLADAALLYDNLPVSNVTTLLPPLQSLLDAASAKNARNFADGMRELTDGCNACHRSLGRGFIMVQVPTDRQTNFGNQRFAPNGKQ